MHEHDIRMLDHRQVLGLFLQTLQNPLFTSLFRQHPLDRHIPLQPQIKRLVDLSSAT